MGYLGLLKDERFPIAACVADLAAVVVSNIRAGLKEEAEKCANLRRGEW